MRHRKVLEAVLVILTALLTVAKAICETDELPDSTIQTE